LLMYSEFQFTHENTSERTILHLVKKPSSFGCLHCKKASYAPDLVSSIPPKLLYCYAENGTVKFLETLADNIFTHNYSMMQI
jgi:hypothetical protein